MARLQTAVLVAALVAGCGSDGQSGDRSMAPVDHALVADASGAHPDLAQSNDDLSAIADLSSVMDMSVAPDLAMTTGPCVMHALPGTCADYAQWTLDWLACHDSCSGDNDCTTVMVHTGTFCKNPCPAVAGKGADGPYLQSLTAAFGQMNCGMGGCACLMPQPPTCVNGMCK